jgi:hypothetical protein
MYAAGFLSALSIVIHQAFGKLHQVNCFSHQHFHRIFACLGYYSEDSSRLLATNELEDTNPTLEKLRQRARSWPLVAYAECWRFRVSGFAPQLHF